MLGITEVVMGDINIKRIERKLNIFVLIWTIGDILYKISNWIIEMAAKYHLVHFVVIVFLENQEFIRDFLFALTPVTLFVVIAIYIIKVIYIALTKK